MPKVPKVPTVAEVWTSTKMHIPMLTKINGPLAQTSSQCHNAIPGEPNPQNPQSDQQAPMGAHPPQAPRLDPVLVRSFQEVEPPGFTDHPESAVEAADFDVDDTIGAE